MKRIFITGIGTNIGKTVVSAIVTEYLNADYWKPIQSGDLMDSDTMKVKTLISNNKSVFHPEKYRLSQPLSPHAAAKRDGVAIKLEDFILPETENHLVIEGAGGLMVPLNNEILIADLIQHLNASVLLVSQNYLGSINHTLLTIQELKRRNITIIGIVINGESTPETEAFVMQYSNLPIIFRVENESSIDQNTVLKYAEKLNFDGIF
ncbi:dethiobiotin synthase [Flavobacterium sp. 83]|uniref:dethiobiotin synthase n=1 Tax=Flavobacterium sp. 83 TaxID=1131812 RepID=UPI00054E6FE0|nr:dethiobiotin synthase [Flavobacterium sp. 83]